MKKALKEVARIAEEHSRECHQAACQAFFRMRGRAPLGYPNIDQPGCFSLTASDIEVEQEYHRLLQEAQVHSAVKVMEERFRAPGPVILTFDGKTVFLKKARP